VVLGFLANNTEPNPTPAEPSVLVKVTTKNCRYSVLKMELRSHRLGCKYELHHR